MPGAAPPCLLLRAYPSMDSGAESDRTSPRSLERKRVCPECDSATPGTTREKERNTHTESGNTDEIQAKETTQNQTK